MPVVPASGYGAGTTRTSTTPRTPDGDGVLLVGEAVGVAELDHAVVHGVVPLSPACEGWRDVDRRPAAAAYVCSTAPRVSVGWSAAGRAGPVLVVVERVRVDRTASGSGLG